MSNNTHVKALSDVTVIVPVVHIWSGQVTVRRDEDLHTASGLPPKTLMSDGGKRIVDPKVLTPLETQRRSINRYLAEVGIRSPMGYLVKPSDEQTVYDELHRRQVLFDQALGELLANYDAHCADWEAKNPEFVEFLRRNRPSVKEVQAACSFGFAPYKVVPADSEFGQQQFEMVAKSATSSLVDDIAASASGILKDSFDGKDKVTQRTVNVVRDLVGKLRGFSMFDPRIRPAADALDKVLAGLPLQGPLGTTDTLILRAMVNSMSDANELLQIGRNLESEGVDEDASEPTAQEVVSSAPAETAASQVNDRAAYVFI